MNTVKSFVRACVAMLRIHRGLGPGVQRVPKSMDAQKWYSLCVIHSDFLCTLKSSLDQLLHSVSDVLCM